MIAESDSPHVVNEPLGKANLAETVNSTLHDARLDRSTVFELVPHVSNSPVRTIG